MYTSPSPENSHIPAARHADSLSGNIAKQRARNRQNRSRSFIRRARPPKRDVRIPLASRSSLLLRLTTTALPFTCGQLLGRDAECNGVTARRGDGGAEFFGSSQTRENVAKGDCVGADSECGAPFFGNGLCQASDAGLGDRVVGLAAVTSEWKVGNAGWRR